MTGDKHLKETQEQGSNKNLSGFFFRKNKFDKTLIPELKQQWDGMNNNDRRKFIIGAVVGLIIFILCVVLLYLLMTNLIPH